MLSQFDKCDIEEIVRRKVGFKPRYVEPHYGNTKNRITIPGNSSGAEFWTFDNSPFTATPQGNDISKSLYVGQVIINLFHEDVFDGSDSWQLKLSKHQIFRIIDFGGVPIYQGDSQQLLLWTQGPGFPGGVNPPELLDNFHMTPEVYDLGVFGTYMSAIYETDQQGDISIELAIQFEGFKVSF